MTTGRQPYRTVTVTISDLIVAQGGLRALAAGKPANQRLKFALASVIREIERHLNQDSTYMASFRAITEEHAERDADGKILSVEDGQSIRIKKNSRRTVDDQMRQLRAVEIELRIPSIATDEIADLGDLSIGDVASMLWLFEEQPYELANAAPQPE